MFSSKSYIFWIDTLKEILHFISLLSAEINRAIRNRVEIKLIIEDFSPDDSQKKEIQHFINTDSIDTRFNNHPLNRFVIIDGKEAMISTNRKNTSEGTSALWTTDLNLIGVLNSYFDNVWSESEELKQTKKQLSTN